MDIKLNDPRLEAEGFGYSDGRLVVPITSESPSYQSPRRRLEVEVKNNNLAHVCKDGSHFAQFPSPEGEGFQPSPMGTLISSAPKR
jgi:hypothetical protein